MALLPMIQTSEAEIINIDKFAQKGNRGKLNMCHDGKLLIMK